MLVRVQVPGHARRIVDNLFLKCVVLPLLLGCGNPASAPDRSQPDPHQQSEGRTLTTSDRKQIVEEDVVYRIDDLGVDKPMGVLFVGHAAVYFLYRDDPEFAVSLAKLRQSKERGIPVRFTYDYRGQRLTSVELVAPRETLNKSILDFSECAESGPGPYSATPNQALACLIRGAPSLARRNS